jgi:hypothetical protein
MQSKQSIPIKFIFPQGKEQIRFANQFVFSQVDMDVLLDIGVVDLKQIVEINQKIQSRTLQPDDYLEARIIERIGMSISSFIKLKQQIDQIFQNLEKQGVLVKKPDADSLQ